MRAIRVNDPVFQQLVEVVTNRMHADGADPAEALEYFESLWDHARTGTFREVLPQVPLSEAFDQSVIDVAVTSIRERLAVKRN